ncbi:RimJ/RimL family protein N-acetyltransferase [Geomicrobium halophilum]|uniref:RimJ/RimL family protein N-acetyltransferase n=1 Tax=Geomicrobium halophilum TaxID=549000 RepID=A0A841PMB6_9BACL|nr:GNAT family N-acetyltransferase [Geomicrobium halophilum]MBB6449900.1 RimJ/RimL family protein N-acetyltransferase [Geomicrobium halophilum]
MIRQLHVEDLPRFENMDTGIEDDYILDIFDHLVTGNHRLYGLFVDGQLVSTGGYTIFANHYAMLGRLRSDQSFQGRHLSTKLMTFVIRKALEHPDIQWVGANTQEHNTPARRVLEKLSLKPQATLFNATTNNVTALHSGGEPWKPIHDLQRKREWIEKTYIRPSAIFPLECYYPFPASPSLFSDEHLQSWSFYENQTQTRFFIAKTDQKKYHYLHVVYPWSDLWTQNGLWETVSAAYRTLQAQTRSDTYIWIDLTREEVNLLPEDHSFTLPSPWLLYGMNREDSVK